MEHLRRLLMLVVSVLVAGACHRDPEPQPALEPSLSLFVAEKTVSHGITEFYVTVQANCEWIVQSDAEWVSLLPDTEEHSLTETLTVKVRENRSLQERTAIIRFLYDSKTKELVIHQEAFHVYLNVSLENISFGYRTAEKVITVTSNSGWEAKSSAPWLAIRPSTGLIGSFEMTVNAETNINASAREAQIHIWNQNYGLDRYVSVTQDGQADAEIKDYIDEYGINYGKGTTFRGLTWAPVNCGYHAQDYPFGKLYQWGRKSGLGYQDEQYQDISAPVLAPIWTGVNGEEDAHTFYRPNIESSFAYDWILLGSNQYWNLRSEEYPVKNTSYDPCPDGWRVPTAYEFKTAIQYYKSITWDSQGGQKGITLYEDKEEGTVFLPAGGRLNTQDGTPYERNEEGYYWTITTDAGNPAYLFFHSAGCSVNDQGSRAGACLVRCIRE